MSKDRSIFLILFRHNNEVYHIRIYTRDVDGCMKHYLVDSLLFESLQVRKRKIVFFFIEILSLNLVFNSILSNPFTRRSFSSS
jgi:hypothetical protein